MPGPRLSQGRELSEHYACVYVHACVDVHVDQNAYVYTYAYVNVYVNVKPHSQWPQFHQTSFHAQRFDLTGKLLQLSSSVCHES